MRAIGIYTCVPELRKCNLSELEWSWDESSLSYWCRHGLTGLALSYLTLECAEGTVFTQESLVSNWIWNVSKHCKDFGDIPEPHLVVSERK